MRVKESTAMADTEAPAQSPEVIRIHIPLRALTSDRGVAILLGAAALLVYLGLSWDTATPFSYFGFTARAIWQGHLWIDGAPLSEIERGVDGHLYNVQPPLPILLMLPVALLGRPGQIDVFVSALFGALSIVPLYLALRALDVPRGLAVWCALLSSFGTTLLYTSIDGRSWFAAQAGAVFFASLALYLAASRRSAVIIGLAIGAAALGRTPVVLALPGLLLLARHDRTSWRELPRAALLAAVGGLPFALLQAGYDLLRWGNPFDIYGPQLHQANDPVLSSGFLSLAYLPRKIYAIFFEAPRFAEGSFFFLRPRSYGMSLLFSTPAFLWLAPAVTFLWSDPRWRAIGLAAALVAIPGLLFATVGYEQYGYRYSLDCQPFLVALVAVGAAWSRGGWRRESPVFAAAVILSIAVTFYVFAAIRSFGFAP